MQPVDKKKKKTSRPAYRWILLALLAAALGLTILLLRWSQKPAERGERAPVDTYGELMVYEAADVASLTVAIPDREPWTLTRVDGRLCLADDPDFPLDAAITEELLDAARVVSYSDVLSDDPHQYGPHLEEFGLRSPTVATVTYTDGRTVTLRIGSRSDEADSAFYYMQVEGDDRLFALDVTTAHTLNTERALLHAVVQPVIHKARIDAVTLQTPQGTQIWQLEGSIADADAADRWVLTAPYRYPADGERMTVLRENLANLRLGAYVAEATPENLAAFGFDQPRLTVTVHQGAGTIGQVSGDGVYGAADWPESTLTLTVGGAKNDNVDYVLLDGSIYITSHFSLQVFMELDAATTLTRYPVLTSLSNLRRLTIIRGEDISTYLVDTEEKLDEQGQPVLDEQGAVVMTEAVTRNGQPLRWDAFEAAYDRLLIVTVSGLLPEGWRAEEEPHTKYVFTTRTGLTHTIGLLPFDALHDAVEVDGCARYYIIRGGLDFAVEPAEAGTKD